MKADAADTMDTFAAQQSVKELDARAVRRAALVAMRSLWKKSGADPVDGVEYQKMMRMEWQKSIDLPLQST
ncbi:MAG TPA: hypothetical protein VF670_11815 [Duganella sp.]|jgi:hypothetical protein